MRDKRPVDELSIEELERILAVRKREARLARLRRYEGRRLATPGGEEAVLDEAEPEPDTEAPAATEPPVQAEPDIYDDGTPRFEDELDELRRGGPRKGQNRAAIWWNRLLLLVEVSAALGLVFLFVTLFESLQEISQTSANIQAQYQATANARLVPPTATPIIQIAAVLPVGHKVKVNDQGVVVDTSFNLDEVPAQYRDQYRVLNSMVIVPPTPEPEGPAPVRIRIAKINVDSTVVEGDSWQTLQLGVGHHVGSANPGERGNMVLSAHNDVYGEIFRHLDKLQPGDIIIVSTTTKDFTYAVQERQFVSPDAMWVLDSSGDERRLTLISCYPYQVDTQRIVVFATLQS